MPLHTIGKLLGASDELKALSARARRLGELQMLYSRSAPRELAAASRVKSYRAGTLVVSADNAAVAAKLRHLAPRLLTWIKNTDQEVTGIRIEVQVGGAAHERVPRSKKILLTPDAIEKFEELSKRVPNGDLKSAIANLVRHHRPRGRAR